MNTLLAENLREVLKIGWIRKSYFNYLKYVYRKITIENNSSFLSQCIMEGMTPNTFRVKIYQKNTNPDLHKVWSTHVKETEIGFMKIACKQN